MPAQPKRLSQVYLRMHYGPVVIGDVLYTAGGSFGPRTQMDFQIVIIHRGSLRLKLDQNFVDVPENYCILLAPGHREHFSFAPDRDTRHSWVAVAPRAVSHSIRAELERIQNPLPLLGRMATLLEMLRSSKSAQKNQVLLQTEATLGLALALLCEFSAAAHGGTQSHRVNDPILARFYNYLASEYARPLSLGDIAKGCGVSRQHLLKVCRAEGKPTPMQQLYRKRLEVAADLLLHSGFPLSQIAEQCGFSNPFHFSRKYKQLWGESPLAWRQHQWKPDEQK